MGNIIIAKNKIKNYLQVFTGRNTRDFKKRKRYPKNLSINYFVNP